MIKFSSKMSDFVINWPILAKNDHFIPNKIEFSRPLNPNRTGCTYLTLFRTVVNRTARGYGTYQCHAQYPEFRKLRVLSSADFSLFKLIKSNLLFLQFLIFSFFIKCFKSVTQQFLNFEFEKMSNHRNSFLFEIFGHRFLEKIFWKIGLFEIVGVWYIFDFWCFWGKLCMKR